MSDCATTFQELLGEVEVVLDEDLPSLRRMSDRRRIERYNSLKADEERFLGEFQRDCPDFLTRKERARVRGKFRLARLLIAASFHSEDGSVPRAMEGDFVDAELQAIVDFDRYRQFDALSESQIERKIRRMDGEVYELVKEYTSTQLETIEKLLEHPDVSQDLMEQLLDRYENRREKIRQGFFTYVETHGLEHTVESIVDAVEAVNSASTERKRITEELHAERESLVESVSSVHTPEQEYLESKVERLERELSTVADTSTLESRIEELERELHKATNSHQKAVSAVDARIDRTTSLEQRLESKITELERQLTNVETESTQAGESARALVETELEKLHEQQEQLQTAVERLQREREQAESVRESLEEKQRTLDQYLSQVSQSVETASENMKGADVVTTRMARLFEMDYLGRFDTSMHDVSTIHTSDGPFDVPEGYWKNRSERRSSRSYLLDILDGANPDRYPQNASSRFEITSSGYLSFGTETEMVIEARVVSNLHAYAENGFNERPAGLDAVLSIVNEVVREAEDGEYEYLLGLASPTGWSEQVQSELLGGEFSTTRYSRYVSLCLIDLQTGTVVYDDSDELIRENLHLFELPTESERVEECIETIRSAYLDDIGLNSVLLEDVVTEHGYDQQIVKRAFNRLENEGVGEQLYVDELGLSLDLNA